MTSGQKQQWLALVRKTLPGRMTAHSVAGALADRLNRKTGRLNPSYQTLANDCGVSEATAKRATQELLKAGLIEKTRPGGKGRGSSNHYRLKGVTDDHLKQPLGGHGRTPKTGFRGSNGGSVRGSRMTHEPEGMNPHTGAPLEAAPGAQKGKNRLASGSPIAEPMQPTAVGRAHAAELLRKLGVKL